MNELQTTDVPRRYWPLGQLMLAKLREFYRQPEAIFWVYGFPIIISLALGFAFRERPVEHFTVCLQKTPGADKELNFVQQALAADQKYVVHVADEATCRMELRTGQADLVVVSTSGTEGCTYAYDPTRKESVLARAKVDDTLQRSKGRKDLMPVTDREVEEPGGRYIDWLIPGLIGMSLMGGGLWGVGFATVDMRIRKVLKRFLATPMRKSDFMAAILISRMILMVPEVIITLLFAWLVFGVVIQGNLLAVAALIVLGAMTFSGLGLLVACRAQTLETISGLMNLVMLPMWMLSGIFFSSERFPDVVQPIIRALPLTPLNSALRAVFLEGADLVSQWDRIAILMAWTVVSFALALRWFRWV
jgi:ABC-type multidrug transport system permease subunit